MDPDTAGTNVHVHVMHTFFFILYCSPNCSFLIADSPPPHLGEKPLLKDVYNLLIGHSAQWDDIGLQLEVPFDDRDGWLNSTLTSRQRLQRVINKWLVSECHTPVTWGELIKILRSDALAFTATVRNIESFLRSETAKETYGRRQ